MVYMVQMKGIGHAEWCKNIKIGLVDHVTESRFEFSEYFLKFWN